MEVGGERPDGRHRLSEQFQVEQSSSSTNGSRLKRAYLDNVLSVYLFGQEAICSRLGLNVHVVHTTEISISSDVEVALVRLCERVVP